MVSQVEGVTRVRRRPSEELTNLVPEDSGQAPGSIVNESGQRMETGVIDVSETAPESQAQPESVDPSTKAVEALTGKIQVGRQARAGLAIVDTVSDVLNAEFKFAQITNKANRNILLAAHQAREVKGLGKEAALREETKGTARGEQAVLAAIAQGQSASGGIAQSGRKAEETFGAYNAMRIETNALRQAYGYEAQIVELEAEIDRARIQKELEQVNAVVSGASRTALAFIGG